MIYLIIFLVGIAILLRWFIICVLDKCLEHEIEPPTLGEVPFGLIRMGQRLHKRGLVDTARFRIAPKPEFRLESES